jgi:ABC-type glycerol-3-phosphate transport system substrate-binding protein
MLRRRFLQTAATLAAAPYVRTSRAAGALTLACGNHQIPGANAVLSKLCNEWGEREKVDVRIDFTDGFNLLMMGIAEASAKSGHDIIALPGWTAAAHAGSLEQVDDVVHPLIAKYGNARPDVEYLGRQRGHWIAVPATNGSRLHPPCARIDLMKQHAGIDIVKMYPPDAPADATLADAWTWDAFLVAAQKSHKAGYPFAIGMGQTGDSVDSAGALFAAYGAQLVDAHGEITVDSDATRQVLEYAKKLVQFLPPDVFGWDDYSNNQWLVTGKTALIMNPPSAWAQAKRENLRIAEQLWTFPPPKGPRGRVQPAETVYWGIWNFSKNKAAAKRLLTHLSQRASVEQLVAAGVGYDIPAFQSLRDFPVWSEAGPPRGTLYHYLPRDDQILSVVGAPAPAAVGVQIYFQAIMTKMIARVTQGGASNDKAIGWAKSILEDLIKP